MTKTDDLHLWRLFCEVVRSGGVNAACEKLQCEPSTVSRAVKALEANWDCRCLNAKAVR